MLIAQLSDLHIRPSGTLYKGVVDSNALLYRAIDHLHQLDVLPDLVLITGDLVDKGEFDEYEMVAQILESLRIPYLLIPGNHDDRHNLIEAFPKHSYLRNHGPLNYFCDDYPVRIIGVDSTVPGEHHGLITSGTLNWLEGVLENNKTKPTLIMLHQPPFACGIPYMDEYQCIESDGLESVIRRYENIEAILCGHVHRLMIHRWAKTVVIGCPSTATEIALQFRDDAIPQSYLGPHGYLLHLWTKAGRFVTHMCNIDHQEGPFPFY